MDNWQLTLLIGLVLMFLNYLLLKFLITTHIPTDADETEAFTTEGFSGGSKETGVVEEFTNDTLYDNFYSKIYDQIVQGDVRVRTETIFTLGWIKKYYSDAATLKILDIGCGTGGHVAEFAKENVGEVTGIDKASAMINRANKLHPNLNFKLTDAEQPLAFAASQFNLVTMYYFTIYYIHHKAQVLRNVFNWLSPGGGFVVHVVNRDKFDPILESASPFMAFSLQKYSKQRVTKSKVSFDKFDYTAEFTNEEADAHFEETFKFKDGRMRKNKHFLHMPAMESLVHEIEQAGFTYKEFIDLTPIGYEYQYLFCFVR